MLCKLYVGSFTSEETYYAIITALHGITKFYYALKLVVKMMLQIWVASTLRKTYTFSRKIGRN